MTKTWLLRGLVLGIAAVGCGETTAPPTVGPTGVAGDTGQVSPLCAELNNSKAFPGMIDPSFNTGSGGGRASFSPFPPHLPPEVKAAPVAPPAISGGTLRISADGKTAVAADPDRDQVYVVDLATRTVQWTVGDLASGASSQAAFQISFLPSSSQENSSPPLVGNQNLTGTDRFTQTGVSATAGSLSTQAPNDPAYTQSDGIVQ